MVRVMAPVSSMVGKVTNTGKKKKKMRDSPVGGSTRGERAACACGQRVSARCARELRVGKRATILVVAARELCRGFAGKAEVLLEFSKVLVCVPHDKRQIAAFGARAAPNWVLRFVRSKGEPEHMYTCLGPNRSGTPCSPSRVCQGVL